MLVDFSLNNVYIGRISAHVMFAFHMHLEQGTHKDSRLISFNLIGIGEASCEQGQEQ